MTGSFYEHPCGQCMACRITKRQEWTLRGLLEWREWKESWYITLTYNDEHLPEDQCVSKEDYRNFIKRLRKAYHKRFPERVEGKNGKMEYIHPLRYMGVAEYGGKFGRPHYHFIIFTDGGIDLGKEKRVWSKATSGWKTIYPRS